MSFISTGNKKSDIKVLPRRLRIRLEKVKHGTAGNHCIMLPCEFKFVSLRMQGDDPLDNPANLMSYVKEIKRRSRIQRCKLRNVRVICLVDQQSQWFVWISLAETLEADSGKISDEMRELPQEVLVFVSKRFATM